MTTLHDFGGVVGQPLDTFFGLSQFHGHNSWLVCEVILRATSQMRLKACDYPNLLHTRRCKAPHKLHSFLCGTLWIMFHGLLKFVLGPLQEACLIQILVGHVRVGSLR